jgi:alkaline phosphatase D
MIIIYNKYMRIPNFKIAAIAIGLLISITTTAQVKDTVQSDNYVVMLSLDGFRWDYSTIYKTPNLNQIATNGIKADAMISCYPSKTFPNHYSMATGLYPDNHGIVNNSFFDSVLGFYSIGDRQSVEFPDFYGGEPIWVTAEKQGVISASFYWVGSETQIKGIQPTYWKKYNQRIPLSNRIDTVIHWLSLPKSVRPRLITWYYQEPDWTSHEYGPVSPKTKAVVENIDSLLGVFIVKVKTLPNASKINIIIVSDHGMASISKDKHVNLSNYINKDWFDVEVGGNPVYSLQPKEQYYKQSLEILKKIPNLKVWERDSIPKRYHYGKNPRISDILIEADLGYSVSWAGDRERFSGGTHGYDNQYPDMQGIFYAFGPAFKKGYHQPAFMNIDLYPLITHILGIKPEPVDGKLYEVEGMLNK